MTERREFEMIAFTDAEEFAQLLREHWLTSIKCDEANGTDTAHCYCAVSKSEPLPTVGAAVEAWIAHVLAQKRF